MRLTTPLPYPYFAVIYNLRASKGRLSPREGRGRILQDILRLLKDW